MTQLQTISVGQLAEQGEQGNVDIIDVRTPLEFREVRAVVARNIPLDALDPHAVMTERSGSAGEPLFVICKSGTRGAKAQQKFVDAGYENGKPIVTQCQAGGRSAIAASILQANGLEVINMIGGIGAWAGAGLPVDQPDSASCEAGSQSCTQGKDKS